MPYLDTSATGSGATLPGRPPRDGYNLPISKLYGVPTRVRLALKVHKITTGAQLLAAAGNPAARQLLAERARITPTQLELLVVRADLARVHGVGVVFGLMLEELGILKVQDLAACDPHELHDRLRRYNESVRAARRSPTPEEVQAWVTQARSLPILVT